VNQAADAGPQSSFEIRPATPADADSIAAIYNQYVGAGPYTMETTRWTGDRVIGMLAGAVPNEMTLIIADESDVNGWGQLKAWNAREGYRICCEISLYLDRDRIGRGAGGLLMDRLIGEAERLEYRHIVSRIVSTNHRSIAFHRRHGFDMVGIQNRVGIIAGEIVDVAIMQKLIPSRDEPSSTVGRNSH